MKEQSSRYSAETPGQVDKILSVSFLNFSQKGKVLHCLGLFSYIVQQHAMESNRQQKYSPLMSRSCKDR